MSKNTIIETLGLAPHIEGGYFKKIYASDVRINDNPIVTSIYFLLDEGNFSALHVLTSDEMWFYHGGNSLHIAMINPEGKVHDVVLGFNLAKGEVPYFNVPKGWIFGSYVEEGYALVSCVVAPGFTYEDFRLFDRKTLIDMYPQHQELIKKLTRV